MSRRLSEDKPIKDCYDDVCKCLWLVKKLQIAHMQRTEGGTAVVPSISSGTSVPYITREGDDRNWFLYHLLTLPTEELAAYLQRFDSTWKDLYSMVLTKNKVDESVYILHNLKLKMALTASEVQSLSLQMDQMTSYSGKLVWRIYNWRRCAHTRAPLTSPVFYSGKFGYKMQLELRFHNIDGPRKDFIGIYLHVLPGQYDPLLRWPFHRQVTFRLENPPRLRCCEKTVTVECPRPVPSTPDDPPENTSLQFPTGVLPDIPADIPQNLPGNTPVQCLTPPPADLKPTTELRGIPNFVALSEVDRVESGYLVKEKTENENRGKGKKIKEKKEKVKKEKRYFIFISCSVDCDDILHY